MIQMQKPGTFSFRGATTLVLRSSASKMTHPGPFSQRVQTKIRMSNMSSICETFLKHVVFVRYLDIGYYTYYGMPIFIDHISILVYYIIIYHHICDVLGDAPRFSRPYDPVERCYSRTWLRASKIRLRGLPEMQNELGTDLEQKNFSQKRL